MPFAFELNAAGLSWIDDQGTTELGVRTGFDVDDVPIFGEVQELRVPVVPNDSSIAGPRLTVRYAPLPEPGVAVGIAVGALVLCFARAAPNVRPPERGTPSGAPGRPLGIEEDLGIRP